MFTYKDLVEKCDMFFIEPGERHHRNMLTLIFQQYICSPEEVIRYITPRSWMFINVFYWGTNDK